ncbi:hypothetical protein AQUCO_06000054v1, partial [Aquilegia coerulea]
KTLPGFQGSLPFQLETGYIGVDESDDVQLFYYFIESERNPIEDPLILWLAGGPGCSALTALFYEIGPLTFDVVDQYNGSFPAFVSNAYSWTKVSSIIFLESPVGTGFSYSRSSEGWKTSAKKSVDQAYSFILQWLNDHPDFQQNPLYIAGDSYSGMIIPPIVEEIANGIEAQRKPPINLKGYMEGNPMTEVNYDSNSRIPFAHRMALISDELFELTKRSCKGNYLTVDSRNLECTKNLQAVSQNYNYLSSYYWANDEVVRNALHVRKGTVGSWARCNTLSYINDIESVVINHLSLNNRGYHALIYSGDHDMVVPYIGTLAWMKSLNLSITDDWRPWFVDTQVAGYTRTYSKFMTFATVKARTYFSVGAGHTAPEYKPKECLSMLDRWLSNSSL